MKKPGEMGIRTDAFFRAQNFIYDHGFPVDETLAIKYLRMLFTEDRDGFLLNFERMREMGYSRKWLLNELFKNNGKVSRIKRTAYVLMKTGF